MLTLTVPDSLTPRHHLSLIRSMGSVQCTLSDRDRSRRAGVHSLEHEYRHHPSRSRSWCSASRASRSAENLFDRSIACISDCCNSTWYDADRSSERTNRHRRPESNLIGLCLLFDCFAHHSQSESHMIPAHEIQCGQVVGSNSNSKVPL